MLNHIAIHDFAIIRELEVEFGEGLNVLSGETGAGKSILVGAVNLLLGGRSSQEMIRTGAKEASVEALFRFNNLEALRERFEALDVPLEEDELIVRRSVNRSGRNKVTANGRMLTVQQLQELAQDLLSVSGQHEHQGLLNPANHLGLLDAFGGLEDLRSKTADVHREWLQTRDDLRKLKRLRQERENQREWMQFQLQELKGADLQPDEDKELEAERNLLRHAATLHDAASHSHRVLYTESGAVLDKLTEVEQNLETICRIDESQQPLRENLEQARIHLEELAHAMRGYASEISFDPHRLQAVEDRLAQIAKLCKKHGGDLAALIERTEELRAALSDQEEAGFQEERLEKRLGELTEHYRDRAAVLSRARREVADRLNEAVQQVLADLDMPKARFGVAFNPESADEVETAPPERFGPEGVDEVEFLLSANPGEDLKPLARVASGGELSRIFLALKSLLSLQGEVETLIFDEVDTGISGRTAELVGLQLKRLAGRQQLICITHLPQIVCYGERHYKVLKQSSEDETTTRIEQLSEPDRIEEVARMLGGISISEKTRAHAKEWLQKAARA